MEKEPKLKIAGTYIVWEDKVLIHKRAETGSEASWHKFAAPGGKVDGDESFIQAAVRELNEEAGLELSKYGWKVLNKIQGEKADSVMYMRLLKEKPIVKGPQDAGSKKAIDSKFVFLAKGVKGEDAGGGYYWAELSNLISFLRKSENKKYNNPYFLDNLLLLKTKLKKQTRKVAK
jgi:ADP-ribose pyrophosphatase YjhB (NUDIX family)